MNKNETFFDNEVHTTAEEIAEELKRLNAVAELWGMMFTKSVESAQAKREAEAVAPTAPRMDRKAARRLVSRANLARFGG